MATTANAGATPNAPGEGAGTAKPTGDADKTQTQTATTESKPGSEQKATDKTDGDAGANAKPQDVAGEKPPPPNDAEFSLKVPEGVVSEDVLKELKALAKEHGVDAKQTQAFVDFNLKLAEQQQKHLTEQRDRWTSEVKADKDFGGERLEATKASIVKLVEKFGGEKDAKELVELLKSDPIGDWPPMFRFLARVAAADGEDVVGSTTSSGAKTTSTEEARLKRSFPSMFSNP